MTVEPAAWIPVTERLPQEGVQCIIAERIPGRYVIDGEPQDGHEIQFGEWLGNRWKCFSIPCASIMHPSMVSHWMPMPPSPTTRGVGVAMSDDCKVKSLALNSLSAYLQWRDSQIAVGVGDVNPFRVWSAGVRYAMLTDAERAAVKWFSGYDHPQNGPVIGKHAAALRSLLERLGCSR